MCILNIQLQIGPTCGLTALSMLLNGQTTATELLADASTQKYTKNGEMFSALYLFELVKKHINSPLECQFHEGSLDCDKIKDQLYAGACLLVPYPFSNNILPTYSFSVYFEIYFMGRTGNACSAAHNILTFGII